MPELWYRVLLHAATRIYYRRVRVVFLNPFVIGDGPVLFVGLHRNGAVDGMLYKSAFPHAVFVIARRLLRSWFTRLYFTGIPVTREHDDDAPSSRRDNARSLDAAVDHLASGGQLFILPEGTSDLGPRHLPFKPGAAKVVVEALERGVAPLIVPMGILYESAPSFRSDVCIVVGAPIGTALDDSLDHADRVAEMMNRITASLEDIAVEADDAATLHSAEMLSAIAADELGATRWRVQKMLTTSRRATMESNLWRLAGIAVDRAGVPRLSGHGVLWNLFWLAVQLPVVIAAATANILPLAGAWLAGRQLADARNTIALWRIIVGAPLTVLWLGVVIASGIVGGVWLPLAYAVITALGLIAYPELCVRWPMFRNSISRRAMRSDVLAIRQLLRAAAAGAQNV